MLDYVYDCIERGLRMSGVIALSQDLPIGEAIEELTALIELSFGNKWENQVVFFPLKNYQDFRLI